MQKPTHLDLFSGIGGFALAARQAGFRTVAFCEIEPYCQRVLAKNFGAALADAFSGGHGSQQSINETAREPIRCSSIVPNIFDLDGTRYRGVALLTGGFPCQPFSVAGKRRGAADDRAIWPQMFRVIGEARPDWILCENVPGIIPMELDNVLSDLEIIGYACRAFVIPACAVDARHRRDRVWIVGRDVADASGRRLGGSEAREIQLSRRGEVKCRCPVSYANGSNGHGRRGALQMGRLGREEEDARTDFGAGAKWLPEPDVGRVAHGIPSRVDRLKGLGNAIVPQVAFEILREIRKLI